MNEKDKALALEISDAFFSNRLPVINGKQYASVHSSPTYNLADKIEAALTTVRQEAREEAFTAIGVELRRYGANIRKVDLLARFQELYRELEAAANSVKDSEDAQT